ARRTSPRSPPPAGPATRMPGRSQSAPRACRSWRRRCSRHRSGPCRARSRRWSGGASPSSTAPTAPCSTPPRSWAPSSTGRCSGPSPRFPRETWRGRPRRPWRPGGRAPGRGPVDRGRSARTGRADTARPARRDAARGALRSAEKRLTRAADAAGDSRLGNEVLRERVSVLTLVGRAAETLELGAARLGLVAGDAHAERAGSPEALCEALGVAGAPPCPGSPSPSPPSPTRPAGCGRPTGSVRGPPSSSGRTGSSPGATTGRPVTGPRPSPVRSGSRRAARPGTGGVRVRRGRPW
ncbi:MAG: hypothetical protein QOJ30_2853, partial [Pseudonocardiales bacterium]|nr:hypothetical protein [Pseudonocardiales bacterium]